MHNSGGGVSRLSPALKDSNQSNIDDQYNITH